jgi:hypothetical protein
MPIIVCSQMPTSTNLGPSEAGSERIAARFSAVITMTRSSSSASSASVDS